MGRDRAERLASLAIYHRGRLWRQPELMNKDGEKRERADDYGIEIIGNDGAELIVAEMTLSRNESLIYIDANVAWR